MLIFCTGFVETSVFCCGRRRELVKGAVAKPDEFPILPLPTRPQDAKKVSFGQLHGKIAAPSCLKQLSFSSVDFFPYGACMSFWLGRLR